MYVKKFRIIALAVALIMVFGLVAACSPEAPAQPATPADTPAPADQDAPAMQETPAETTPAVTPPPPVDPPAVAYESVTIGLMGPHTGPAAQFGIAVRDGAMLYIDAFNARGGLQILVEMWDDEHNAALAVMGYNHLVDQGVTAILGGVTSGPTMAVVPLAYEENMPMITASATHAGVTVDQDTGRVFTNMFRSCFIDPFQGTKMAEFAVEVVGAATAAVLYSHEIDYSIGLMEAFIARAEQIGLEIIAVERFADDAIDFSGQLINIAAANPDVLFVPAYHQHIALIGPASVAAGLDTTFLGADGWAAVLEFMPDPSSIEGAFFLTGFTTESDSPRVQDFISRYIARHGDPPNMFAAQAYDAAMILIAAIERALADGHSPGTQTFKLSVIAHMAATDIEGVTGRITYDEFNNPQKTAFIVEIVGGVDRFWGEF